LAQILVLGATWLEMGEVMNEHTRHDECKRIECVEQRRYISMHRERGNKLAGELRDAWVIIRQLRDEAAGRKAALPTRAEFEEQERKARELTGSVKPLDAYWAYDYLASRIEGEK